MEVPVINRISDFDVGINDPSFLSRAFDGKLHHAYYSFLKWGALLLIAFFASFTTLTSRIKSLVLRLRNGNVSLPSPTLLYDYDSDTDSSCSSDSSEDDEDEDDDDDKEDDSANGGLRVRGGSAHWMRRCSGSLGDLLSWPDLGGLGSSGVVKLWDHLDINGEGSGHRGNAVASFFGKCGASSLLSPAEKKASDAVEVGAWDASVRFNMPALVAEWRQPAGRIFGKIVMVNDGDVDKIYDVENDVTVGDMRMVNGALTDATESDVVTMVRRRRRH